MLQFTKTETGFLVTCTGNDYYLADGVISMPSNSLSLLLDAADIAVFKKSATGDVFITGKIGEVSFDGETPDRDGMPEAFAECCLTAGGGGSEDLEQRVAALEDAMDDAETDLYDLSGEVEENGRVTSEALTSLRSTILENERVTSEALTELRALTDGISDELSDTVIEVGGIGDDVSALESSVDSLEEEVENRSEVSSAALTQLRRLIAQLDARLTQAETSVTSLGGRMTQAETDITTLDTVMSAAVNQLS